MEEIIKTINDTIYSHNHKDNEKIKELNIKIIELYIDCRNMEIEKEHYKSKLTDLKVLLEEKIEVLEKQNLHECQKKNKDFINDGKYLTYQEILKEIGDINDRKE